MGLSFNYLTRKLSVSLKDSFELPNRLYPKGNRLDEVKSIT